MESRFAREILRSSRLAPTGERHRDTHAELGFGVGTRQVARAGVQHAWSVLLAVLMLWPTSRATPVQATPAFATITVNTLADEITENDGCSLREAITNANDGAKTYGDCPAGAVAATFIGFSVSGTIGLTSLAGADLPISGFVSINGGNTITLSGGNSIRLFNMNPGGALTLQNIVLTDGYAGSSYGGAIYVNSASLRLDHTTIQNSHTNGFAGSAIFTSGGSVSILNNSVIQNNYGSDYGAINSTGIVTVTNSIVHDNRATTGGGAFSVVDLRMESSQVYNNASADDGGAIYVPSGSQASIRNSQLWSNQAGGGDFAQGGAIANKGGTLAVTNATLTGNTAVWGGGIYNSGTTTLLNSTLNGNFGFRGGGLANESAATLINSTLSGNSANAQFANGGGIFSNNTLTLTNVTLSGNSSNTGGGFYIGGVATLRNTLIANSLAGNNCSGLVTSNDFNLSTDDSCVASFNKAHDWNTVNANLGLLANNGGPTPTQIPFPLPAPGNRAIDGGNGCPSTDQRGVMRPQGGACDIGAVEYVQGEKSPWLYLPLIVR